MTEAQIKYMANRFLGWKLPEHFNPDGGISFKKTFNDHMPQPMKNEPTGTNIFDATQADAMVRYMIQGMPGDKTAALPETEREALAAVMRQTENDLSQPCALMARLQPAAKETC